MVQGEHAGSFVLRVLVCFLKVGILGEGLSRTFISFPGVSFSMFMHQNENVEALESFSGQLYLCLEFVWF